METQTASPVLSEKKDDGQMFMAAERKTAEVMASLRLIGCNIVAGSEREREIVAVISGAILDALMVYYVPAK